MGDQVPALTVVRLLELAASLWTAPILFSKYLGPVPVHGVVSVS